MKTNKTQIIKIKDIKIDQKLYPRNQPDWITIYKYQTALQTGTTFPPITLATRNQELILVDGMHRLKAHQNNKQEYITANILHNLTDGQIYVEAVRLNTTHGHPFSAQEIAKSIQKLKTMNISLQTISEIIHMPIQNIEKFVAKRMVNTLTGEELIVKKPLNHLARQHEIVNDNIDENAINGSSQENMLQQTLMLIQNNLLDISNNKIKKLVEQIYEELTKIMK